MNLTIDSASRSAEDLMRSVLREGEEIADEYPLVFDDRFDGRIVTARDDEELLSTCAFLVRELVIGPSRVRVGLIGSVATDPEHRRQGHGSQVLLKAEEELARRGCVFSLLWADEPQYYAGRGYVPIGAELNYVIHPEQASLLPDCDSARLAQPDDIERIHALYLAHSARVERSFDETRALLAGPGIETLVTERAGRAVAYSCLGRGGDLQTVVHEWGGDAEDVLALVHAHLDRQSVRRPLFMLVPAQAREVREYFELVGIRGAVGVLGMGKLLDVDRAGEILTEVAPQCTVLALAASEPALRVSGPSGQIDLDGPNLLLTLFAPKLDRGVVDVVESQTGLELGALPLAPFVWGLDSI
ncbi:MAG: GNAT family N-acetyltransferase [bacterium]|nr:GNAT family N-acetyltransferase [bacterium]